MKLNTQQKITAAVITLLFIVAIGATVFINTEPNMVDTENFALSTSTPTQSSSSTGWWYAIPTDPSLPAMQNGSISTLTPTPTLSP